MAPPGAHPTDAAGAPRGVPGAAQVMARLHGENFPVASRILGASARRDLLALYGFARLVDELGDSLEGDRAQALDWLERELELAFEGCALHPLLVRLQPTLRARKLSREPFVRLIDANRMDQTVARYATWEQLRGYCALSADPVGELVLGVFGLATPERIAFSDKICTALQLLEHCQDVAEDHARGRVYLPLEDMQRFGCTESELAATRAGAPLRATIAFEVARARTLFGEGEALIGMLRGRQRFAIAAVLSGGVAALDAIERADFDTLAGPPAVGNARRARVLADTLIKSRGSGR